MSLAGAETDVTLTIYQALQIVGMLIAVVWTVSSIRNTTAKLGVQIEALANTITELSKWLSDHDHQIKNHEGRLANVEGQIIQWARMRKPGED